MFRISHVLGAPSPEHDRRRIAEVHTLLSASFPYLAKQPDYIARKLTDQTARGVPAILLIAHGNGARGWPVSPWPTTSRRSGSPTSILSSPSPNNGRGLGGAAYEAAPAKAAVARGARGLFLEVPTDDPAQVTDPATLKQNRGRLKFYERYGALPVVGTLYDQPIRPSNPVEPRLLYDPLNSTKPLTSDELRDVIRNILTHRYQYEGNDPYVEQVVRSVKESPVRTRRPRLLETPAMARRKDSQAPPPLKVFFSAHALHHVRERGYVERPTRVDVILKALEVLPDVERLPTRNFGERPIRAVHDVDFVNYLPHSAGPPRRRVGVSLCLPDPSRTIDARLAT